MKDFMNNIKGRCRIDEITGCWIWMGALSNGYPRIYAPDFTRNADGAPMPQNGTRAIWHVRTGKAIPKGHRVYHAACHDPRCVNPDHLQCGPTHIMGKKLSESGILQNRITRIKANRAIGRARSKVNPEMARYIVSSSKTGQLLAQELNISRSIISRVRRGTLVSVLSIGNPFGGLLQ